MQSLMPDFVHFCSTIGNFYFHEISLFPKILNFRLFGNLWGNSYIQFLVIKSNSVLLVVKRKYAKRWKKSQLFCDWLLVQNSRHLRRNKKPKFAAIKQILRIDQKLGVTRQLLHNHYMVLYWYCFLSKYW